MFKKFSENKEVTKNVEEVLPQKFESELQKRAPKFEKSYNNTSKGFKMDRVLLNKAGIFDIQEKRIERRVKEVVAVEIDSLKKAAKEEGYQEGFNQGKREGHQQALKEQKLNFEEDVYNQKNTLDSIDQKVSTLYDDIVSKNQKKFVDLLILCVEKLVYKHVGISESAINKIVDHHFSDLKDVKVNIKLNQIDYSSLQSELFEKFENKNIVIEVDGGLNQGDLIVDSGYLKVEYSLVEGFSKIWQELENEIT